MDYDVTRKAIAEFVGTFALLLTVIGSIVVSGQGGLVGTALAQGFILAVMISSLGHVSGAHFNPAVTLGFLLTRRIQPALAVIYMIAQVAGAVAAALLVEAIYPDEANLDSAATVITDAADFSTWEVLILEALFTFLLVWVVFATAVDEKGTFSAIAGFGIGLVLTVAVLTIGPISGASLNPARTFAVALVQNEWGDAWVYYIATFGGGAIAALLYTVLYLPRRTAAAG
jgi:MIP family channel proteins